MNAHTVNPATKPSSLHYIKPLSLYTSRMAALSLSLVAVFSMVQAEAGVLKVSGVFAANDQSMWKGGSGTKFSQNFALLEDIGWGRRDNRFVTNIEKIEDITTPEITVRNPKWTAWKAKKSLHQKFPNTSPAPGKEPMKNITAPGQSLGKFGAALKTESMARFGVDLETEISGGTIDVNLPVFAEFSFDDEALIAGQSFILKSDYLVGSDARLTTASPSGSANLVLNANLDIDASVDVYLGADEPASVELLQGLDVDVRIPVLGLEGGEGVEILSTPIDKFDELLVSEGLQALGFVAKKEIVKPESDAIKMAKQELADANKDLIDAEAENKQLKKEEQQADSFVSTLDRDIENSEIAIARYDEFIAANNMRQDEVDKMDAELAKNELSEQETQSLVNEREDLAKKNEQLMKDGGMGSDTEIAANRERQQEIDGAIAKNDETKQQRQQLASEKEFRASQNERMEDNKRSVEKRKDQDARIREVAIDSHYAAHERRTTSDQKKQNLGAIRDEKLADVKKARDDKNKKKKGGKFQIAKALPEIIEEIADVVDGTFSLPVVETYSGLVPVNGPFSLTASGEDQFMEVRLDVDSILTLMGKAGLTAYTGGFGAPVIVRLPGLTEEIELTDYLRAEYAVLDLNVGANAYVTQSFDFTPTFEVSLDIGSGSPIRFDLGDDVEIQLPDNIEHFDLKPTIQLKNTISSSLGFRIQPAAELAAMGFVAGVTPPPEIEGLVKGRDTDVILTAVGCIPIPRQQGGSYGGGSQGGSPTGVGYHNCQDKYPLAGSINGLDLIPDEYSIDPALPEAAAEKLRLHQNWELQGFEDIVGESMQVVIPTLETLEGGTFDMLTDAWGTLGDVVISDGVAQLTTASPVNLFTTIDTPSDPFHLLFDYRFDNPDSGFLSIFLDGVLLDMIQAVPSPSFLTGIIYIDDVSLLGRTNLVLDFEYLDTTGRQLFLDNVGVTAQVAVSGPATLFIFLFGVALLFARLKYRKN
jgi:hypothetical protein